MEVGDGVAASLTVDFTKQYNRLRQQHNAQTPQAGASSSRLDQRPVAPARAPLPARNLNVARDSGVALNPKSQARSSKDKSDRATQEQVLDPRTRLVLSGLVNRGIVGEVERCISTGKEVSLTLRPWLMTGKRLSRSKIGSCTTGDVKQSIPGSQNLSNLHPQFPSKTSLHCRRVPIQGGILVIT